MFSRALILASAFCALAVPAFAAPILVYVSGKGADAAGCGAVTAPCRTMQVAHDRVEAGGYIVALDPADFGDVAIRKSISIANQSAGAALLRAPAPFTCGLGVFGQETVVRLHGLTIEGNGPNTWGVCFKEGKRFEIADSVVRNATNAGVSIQGAFASPSLLMLNTTVANNGAMGAIGGVSSGYVKGLRVINNFSGGVSLRLGSAFRFFAPVVIEDSLIANDPGRSASNAIGVSAQELPLVLRNTTVRGFPTGVSTNGAIIRLSRSILTGNAGAALGARIESAGDNIIRGNVDDTLGALTPVANH